MRIIYELLEELLNDKEFDKDFQEELSAACPNYMNVLLTSKRDLLRNDCGIVIAGETSAGKTTLLNLLVGENVFVTSNLAATGTVCRIRNSKSMSIKMYTKDERLIAEETADDLTGNVIIVDTPGISESDTLTDILLDFLPHAVSFVFIINARNAGEYKKIGQARTGTNSEPATQGRHEMVSTELPALLRILKTVIEKGKEMPCFEPEEVIFLTNQWDIINNTKEDEDEEDQHTKTLNKIKIKLEEYWPGFCEKQLFQTSLIQVGQSPKTYFTDEFERFQTALDETIEKNKNKRVEYYFRFIQKFAINAEMGIASRLHLLKISDDDRNKTIVKTLKNVGKLATISHEKMMEAKGFKTEVIAKLTEKLSSYLHSDTGRNEILNPRFKKPINSVPIVFFNEEVFTRINMGISRWCEGDDVYLIIQEIESKVKTILSDVESMIHTIEEDITGKTIPSVSFIFFPRSTLRMNLMSNEIKTNEFVKLFLDRPAVDYSQLATEKKAHQMYKESTSYQP
ncbi:unnamed protein product [Mytilus coruscus]|uniref:Dynamin N-terminal domain-containing protein n=1 Tax=Mytilus coruscus TaxID=42192 RepID=A0A6J8E9X0_MYTCO|nr:unnamed protein product [Mytilus coruscus]